MILGLLLSSVGALLATPALAQSPPDSPGTPAPGDFESPLKPPVTLPPTSTPTPTATPSPTPTFTPTATATPSPTATPTAPPFQVSPLVLETQDTPPQGPPAALPWIGAAALLILAGSLVLLLAERQAR